MSAHRGDMPDEIEEVDLDALDAEDIELPQGAKLADEQYPPYVVGKDQRDRFQLAYAIAWQIFEGDATQTWQAARSIYKSEIPTEEPDES